MTTSTAIARLNAADPDFAHHLDHLLSWESVSDDSVNQRVLDIIKAVRERGDAALVDFTRQFDGLDVKSMSDLILPRERLELALTRITAPQREALELAAARVRSYHEKQKQDSWSYTEADGTVLGQKVTPLDRAGLYVPGGKASYPSSVLMNAIPAKVAGVTEVVMVVPTHAVKSTSWSSRPPASPVSTACSPSAAPRLSRRWPTAPKACRWSTRWSAPATSMSPPPSAMYLARSVST